MKISTVLIALAFSVQSSTVFGFECDGRHISDEFVNDDFCDCTDGSDEPKTNACARLELGNDLLFQCADTKGFQPTHVPAHVLKDGVCDCCDGSDEPEGLCTDECAEWARQAQEKARVAEERRIAGMERLQTYIDSGRKGFEEKTQEIHQKETELNQASEELDSLEQREKELKRADEETKESRQKEAEEFIEHRLGFQSLTLELKLETLLKFAVSANETGIESLLALITEQLPAELTDTIDDVEVLSLAMEASETMFPPEATEGEEPKQPRPLNEVIADLKQAIGIPVEHHGSLDGMAVQLAKEMKRSEALCRFVWEGMGVQPPTDLPLFLENTHGPSGKSDQLKEVEREVRDARTKKKNLEKEVREIEELREIDFGSLKQWFTLSDRCLSKHVGTFDYKICPFQESKQDHTSIGKFARWEQKNVMFFENGAKCWNGPKRSLKVTFVCGPEEDILSVEEPETCTYTAEAMTPAACGDN